MTIEEFKFSDINFTGCELDGQDVWIYTTKHYENKAPEHLSLCLEKDDVIALAKNFKLTADDLI